MIVTNLSQIDHKWKDLYERWHNMGLKLARENNVLHKEVKRLENLVGADKEGEGKDATIRSS
jgi:hypothetical protein